jgi:hypothetical protein
VVINDDLEQGFKQLKAAISKFRPDLIPPPEDDAAAQAARKAAASNQPVPLVVLGPSGVQLLEISSICPNCCCLVDYCIRCATVAHRRPMLCNGASCFCADAQLPCAMTAAGGGREQLVQQLLQRYPQRFVVPRKLTDRKPAKGEKDTQELEFVKPDVLTKLAAQGQVVHSQADAATGSTIAVTADVLHELAAAGEECCCTVYQHRYFDTCMHNDSSNVGPQMHYCCLYICLGTRSRQQQS